MDREIALIRWATFGGLVLAGAAYLYPTASAQPERLPLLGAMILLAAALLSLAVEWWLRLLLRRLGQAPAPLPLQEFTALLADHHDRLMAAQQPSQAIEALLENGCRLFEASGASFVPFNEWGRLQPALTYGRIPHQVEGTWDRRLLAPETRQACKACQTRQAGAACTLLEHTLPGAGQVICVPLRRDGREFGMLNFFQAGRVVPGLRSHRMLEMLVHATEAALASLQRRERETEALRFLQSGAGAWEDLPVILAGLLENLRQGLEVDFTLLWSPRGVNTAGSPSLYLVCPEPGEYELPDDAFLDGLLGSVRSSGKPLALENVTFEGHPDWRSLLVMPLAWGSETVDGIMVLGSSQAHRFSERQLLLLQTVAGQAALLIQNARLAIRIEYQAVVDERTRLAREIHDGLAQTLAFLKLQASQMIAFLDQGQLERLPAVLASTYRTLDDAYVDARQSIDNLRQLPELGLERWAAQVAQDFSVTSGLEVDISGLRVKSELSPTVQAQLIRILQEALNNVRKHAQARQVVIAGWDRKGEVVFEISDDGRGFAPDAVHESSRYGLRGMRERAEMIGADFQVISQPGDGTIVRLRLPLEDKI